MQPSKMQTIKSLFTPTDRRAPGKKRLPPPPVAVGPHPGQSAGANLQDLTPTRHRGLSNAAHEEAVGSFYQQRSQTRSQPDLPSARRPQVTARATAGSASPEEVLPQHAFAPPKESFVRPPPAPPRRNPSTDRLPAVKMRAFQEEQGWATERGDEVKSLPSLFGHRRGGGSQDTSGSHAVVPDYSSSVTSGFLSRGPSTNSTARSDATFDFRRQSLEACSVQQDFFLGGLHLSHAQRSQLLVSLPDDIIVRYCSLYDYPWRMADAQRVWPAAQAAGLEEERLMAGSRVDLDGDSQVNILRASQAVLKTTAGQLRLCRFMHWLLQGDADASSGWGADDVFDAPALTAPEVRALLEPLRLTSAQQARLKKHCRYLPQRLEPHRGFASPVSYKGF